MAISEYLRNAVDNKDIAKIHSAFYSIILSDPFFEFGRFDEALMYVKNADIEGFIDVHDGEELEPQEEWNEEYFDYLISKLQDNFSEVRIDQVKKVARGLNSAIKMKKEVKTRTVNENKSQKEIPSHNLSGSPGMKSISKRKSNIAEDVIYLCAIGIIIVAFIIHKLLRKR